MERRKEKIGRILQALANDQLFVNDINQKKTSEHQRLSDKCCELQEKLEQKLDDEGKVLLTELVDAIYDEEFLENVRKFDRGFSLGALLMLEITEHYDSFFGKEVEK